MPVSKGRCARDVLPDTFDIGVFKTFKMTSTIILTVCELYSTENARCTISIR